MSTLLIVGQYKYKFLNDNQPTNLLTECQIPSLDYRAPRLQGWFLLLYFPITLSGLFQYRLRKWFLSGSIFFCPLH